MANKVFNGAYTSFPIVGKVKWVAPNYRENEWVAVTVEYIGKVKGGKGITSSIFYFCQEGAQRLRSRINSTISFTYWYCNHKVLKNCKAFANTETLRVVSEELLTKHNNDFEVTGYIKRVTLKGRRKPVEQRFYEFILVLEGSAVPEDPSRVLRVASFMEDTPDFVPKLRDKVKLLISPVFRFIYDNDTGEAAEQEDGRKRKVARFVVLKAINTYAEGTPTEEEKEIMKAVDEEDMDVNNDNSDDDKRDNKEKELSNDDLEYLLSGRRGVSRQVKPSPLKAELEQEILEKEVAAAFPTDKEVEEALEAEERRRVFRDLANALKDEKEEELLDKVEEGEVLEDPEDDEEGEGEQSTPTPIIPDVPLRDSELWIQLKEIKKYDNFLKTLTNETCKKAAEKLIEKAVEKLIS